jgi:hypothetical protein
LNGLSPAPGRTVGRSRTPTLAFAGRRTLLTLLFLGCLPGGIGAQAALPPDPPDAPAIPPRALLLSAALPGMGHHITGQRRWAGYLIVDALSWAAFAESRRRGSGLEEAYRDLAWVAARNRIQPRRDGAWQYYEELVKFGASGALDADPDREGVQPETDPSTHNGSIWALAVDLFLPGGVEEEGGVAYNRALEYYLRRGIPPEFAWDWKDNAPARTSYRTLINASDRERRRSVGYAGVLLANRVLSVVDLYVISRTGRNMGIQERLQAQWDPAGSRPWILLRLPAP